MQLIYVDYESYYDDQYSLRKMTPAEYILNQRFECTGAAVAIGDAPAKWIDGDRLQSFFDALDAEKTILVYHNALFDACITAWRFGFTPRLTVDTMSMTRALLGHRLRSVSLEKVALHLGIGVKGGTIHQVKGMGGAAIKAAGLWESYTDYAINDVEICRAIYKKLKPRFPASEMVICDTIIRCAITPQIRLDANKLSEHLMAVRAGKEQLLAQCGIQDRGELLSNDKFAECLRMLGVEPPMKTSLLTQKETYAFAKTDQAFIELEEHDNPAVQQLVAARLGIKSTIEETRTERLLSISQLTWPGNVQAQMPMPLRYAGAHTHRLSGDWKLNMQNLPRGGALRGSLIAPEGYEVLTCDASQIEARIVAWLAGQDDLVADFAAGADVYSKFAGESVYGYPVNKKDHPTERFLGKTSILGLGFGMGAPKFERTVQIQANAQGISIEMDALLAAKTVSAYRTRYSKVPEAWKYLQGSLPGIASGSLSGVTWGPVTFEQEAVLLPSGLRLHYHKLRAADGGWQYEYGEKPKYIFGGKLFENIVQALARIVVMDAAVRLRSRLAVFDLQLAHQVHDELIYVVPKDLVKVVKAIVLEEMRRRPAWAPTLPLDAEAGSGPSYGDAK